MALFDLKNIKKNIQKSTDDLMKTVSDVTENLPDILEIPIWRTVPMP